MAPQIGDLWCEPSSGKGSLAGEVQKVLFFLAIFTLSSGILPRGSNLKEKKKKSWSGMIKEKTWQMLLFWFPLNVVPKHTRRSVLSNFERWICWRIDSNIPISIFLNAECVVVLATLKVTTASHVWAAQ